MIGISETTGKHLGDLDHLRQCIKKIITTRIGTRVMRRDFGSRIAELIDTPIRRQCCRNAALVHLPHECGR